jgi:hypothetical protein
MELNPIISSAVVVAAVAVAAVAVAAKSPVSDRIHSGKGCISSGIGRIGSELLGVEDVQALVPDRRGSAPHRKIMHKLRYRTG